MNEGNDVCIMKQEGADGGSSKKKKQRERRMALPRRRSRGSGGWLFQKDLQATLGLLCGVTRASRNFKQNGSSKKKKQKERRMSCSNIEDLQATLGQQHRQEKEKQDGAEEAAAGQEHSAQEAEEKTLQSVSLGVLPQDLAIAVLMRLPLRSLVQMRVLSTSFNALLRSPPFQSCSQLPWIITVKVGNTGPGPDMRAPRELIAYCSDQNTWFPLPIRMHSNLLSAMGGPGLLQVPSIQYSWPILSALAMASCGGLMCTVVTALRPEAEHQQAPPPELNCDVDDYLSKYVFNYKDFHLLVFNCLTGASKRLPPPPPHCSSPTSSFLGNNLFVHMFLDASAPGAYNVVIHNCEQGTVLPPYIALSIYSSRTGCWMDGHATSAGPYPCTFGDIRKSDLFSYRYNDNEFPCCFGTLFAYAIHSDSWLSIPIIPAEEPGWDSVFKWQGRVFLASSLMDAGFKVCALTSSSRWSKCASWVEVARTPASLFQSFATDIMTCDLNFVLCGNLVCMTGFYSRTVGYGRTYLRPLVYDLAGDFWYYLPPPCIKGTTTDFGVALLAFQPHLQATP